MKRISVYIDGANFIYGLKSINPRYKDFNFDFARFVKQICRGNQLVKVHYYNAALKQDLNPILYQRQQRFFQRLKDSGFDINLARRQPRTNNDGDQYFTIKGDDIWLAIDMLRGAYEDEYDTAILISGDGDFEQLVRCVKKKGKRVENLHFKNQISMALVKECNQSAPIDKKTVNKLFYREKKKK